MKDNVTATVPGVVVKSNGGPVEILRPKQDFPRTCPYCGMLAQPDWLVCGEGQWWGCGGALNSVSIPSYESRYEVPGLSRDQFMKKTNMSVLRQMSKAIENIPSVIEIDLLIGGVEIFTL